MNLRRLLRRRTRADDTRTEPPARSLTGTEEDDTADRIEMNTRLRALEFKAHAVRPDRGEGL